MTTNKSIDMLMIKAKLMAVQKSIQYLTNDFTELQQAFEKLGKTMDDFCIAMCNSMSEEVATFFEMIENEEENKSNDCRD